MQESLAELQKATLKESLHEFKFRCGSLLASLVSHFARCSRIAGGCGHVLATSIVWFSMRTCIGNDLVWSLGRLKSSTLG